MNMETTNGSDIPEAESIRTGIVTAIDILLDCEDGDLIDESTYRLIEAAPDLLAALQVLVNDPHDTEPDCWANAARAVAKATGGEA